MEITKEKMSNKVIAKTIIDLLNKETTDECLDVCLELLKNRNDVLEVTEKHKDGGGKLYCEMDEKLKERIWNIMFKKEEK